MLQQTAEGDLFKVKINDVRLRRVKMPRLDPQWRTASYAGDSVDGFILEIFADGVTGLGGTAAHPRSTPAAALEAELRGPVSAALVGASPLSGNGIREAIKKSNVRPRALLAADLALHDLVGKLASLPCHALWGGALRLRVTIVRMVGIKPPQDLVAHVGTLVEQGYTHLKVKVGTGIAEDAARLGALRGAFGEALWIGVDANGAYTPEEALELSRALEPYGVSWLEQPIDYGDLDGLARLTAESAIPVMADQSVVDVASALRLCQRRAAHIVSIKATKMGSLDECRRVYEICRSFGVRVHMGGVAAPAVVDVAQAQLAASLPDIEEECEVGEFLGLEGDPVSGVVLRNEQIELGSAAGWGVRLLKP